MSGEIIMELIESLRQMIEGDLVKYEAGERHDFILMKYVPEVGMVVPFLWIDQYMPEYVDKWHKFMSGQTVSMSGVYDCDVRKFLNAVERDIEDTSP